MAPSSQTASRKTSSPPLKSSRHTLESVMYKPALKIAGLTSGYGDIRVLRGVDLELKPGTIVALIGSNGAGKTTLLRTISGLVKADSGSSELYGESIHGLAPHRVV